MKRFITYLHEYHSGKKGKLSGFIKVDLRGTEVRMELHICNMNHLQMDGKIYLLVEDSQIIGVYAKEINLANGAADCRLCFAYKHIFDSDYDFSKVVGVAIVLNAGYLASCWTDVSYSQIFNGTFTILTEATKDIWAMTEDKHEDKDEDKNDNKNDKKEIPKHNALEQQMTCELKQINDEKVIYKKIGLMQIRDLPAKNRHLCNNSFLIHGFLNYHYLILREQEGNLCLGVPGVYEQPEKMIAAIFEFSEFEALDEVEDRLIKKENHVAKEGTFGAWFTKLINP